MIDRIPQSPPVIKPISDKGERPLWSVMVPTYNCSNYLKETLQSVLVQAKNITEMQIEVIDDCSTDDNVEAIVNDIGKGRIGFFRQTENVGSLRNFETCINRSRGQLIHILHGDDMVEPGFYSEIKNLFKKHSSIGAAFTGLTAIDEKNGFVYHNNHVRDTPGIIDDWLLTIAVKQRLQVCSMVVKRSVYEELGSFYAVHYGEDWEMWARIATKFQVAYSPKDLALYRVHSNNISTRFSSTGQNIKDIKTVVGIIQNYLPADKKKGIKKIARRIQAIYFTQNAQQIYKVHRDKLVAIKQARGALLLHFNKTTLISLLKLYVKVLINYKSKS
jgi:glycosyltransferase involved in cell wall biosynthesis